MERGLRQKSENRFIEFRQSIIRFHIDNVYGRIHYLWFPKSICRVSKIDCRVPKIDYHVSKIDYRVSKTNCRFSKITCQLTDYRVSRIDCCVFHQNRSQNRLSLVRIDNRFFTKIDLHENRNMLSASGCVFPLIST